MARIIVCGGNGAGKSTLGKSLASELGYKFEDIENYYFPKDNPEYEYAVFRTREAVAELLLADLEKYTDFVLASVKGNYGKEVEELFDIAVYIEVPKEVREKRVYERSYKQFGERMLPGGDLYESEKRFFDMVSQRPADYAEKWLNDVNIPIIKVDGTQPIEKSVEEIKRRLSA